MADSNSREGMSDSAIAGLAGTLVAIGVDELLHLTPLHRFAAAGAALAAFGATYELEHGGVLDHIKEVIGMDSGGHEPDKAKTVESIPSKPQFLEAAPILTDPLIESSPADQGFTNSVMFSAGTITGALLGTLDDTIDGSVGFAGAQISVPEECGTGQDQGRAAYEDILHHGVGCDAATWAADPGDVDI